MPKPEQPHRIPHSRARTSKSAQAILDSAQGYDEPVFVIRAKDHLAIPTLQFYINQVRGRTNPTPQFLQELNDFLIAMKTWRAEHIERIGYPD